MNLLERCEEGSWAIQPIASIGCLLAQGGSIFERELGDAGFVEVAKVSGNHAGVLFLCAARERQIETEIALRARAHIQVRSRSNTTIALRRPIIRDIGFAYFLELAPTIVLVFREASLGSSECPLAADKEDREQRQEKQ